MQFFGALLVGALLLVGSAVFLTQRPVWMNGEVGLISSLLCLGTLALCLMPNCTDTPGRPAADIWMPGAGTVGNRNTWLFLLARPLSWGWILDVTSVIVSLNTGA